MSNIEKRIDLLEIKMEHILEEIEILKDALRELKIRVSMTEVTEDV